MTEWYKRELDQPPPVPLLPSLFDLTLRVIHDHFSSIVLPPSLTPSSSSSSSSSPLSSTYSSPLSCLSSGLMQVVIDYMMKQRKRGSRALNDNTVHSLFLPSLFSLDLEGFWVSHSPFVHYNCPFLTVLNLKNCIPVQDAAIQKICSMSPHIEVMILKNLHHLTGLSTQAISGTSSQQKENEIGSEKDEGIRGCRELRVLVLSCKSLTEDDLLPVINNCQKLTVLKLYRATRVKVEHLLKLKNLEVLVLNKCEVTDQDMQLLLSSLQLKYLKIENCASLSGQSIARTQSISTLNRLKFVECIKLENISNILHHCPNLNSLSINSCKKVTDSTLQGLLEFPNILNQMKIFKIQHNTRITDATVKPLVWRFGDQMKELDFTACTKISKIFETPEPTGNGIILQKLECMVLDGCKSVDFFPEHCMFPNIMYLDISGVTISDATLIRILTPLTQLHTLQIKCCHGLTGAFCLTMTQNNLVPNLLRMQLANCAGIREEVKILGTRHNLKIALNSLRFLDIGGLKIKTIQIDCPNLEIIDVSYTFLETNVIEHIISGVPRLTNFWAKKQSNVTPVLLRDLSNVCPKLQVMDISYCEQVTPSLLMDIVPLFKNVYPFFERE